MKKNAENGGQPNTNHMRLSEVRQLLPDTFVLVEDQKSQVVNGELHIEEHTKHDEVAMPIRTKPVYRGVVQ